MKYISDMVFSHFSFNLSQWSSGLFNSTSGSEMNRQVSSKKMGDNVKNVENQPPGDNVLPRPPAKAPAVVRKGKRYAVKMEIDSEEEADDVPVLKERRRGKKDVLKERSLNTVSTSPAVQPSKLIGTIIYNDQHYFRMNKNLKEAIRASKYGHFHYHHNYVDLPTKKFGHSDLEKFGEGVEWPVQEIFKTEDAGVYLVLFEGWAANTAYFADVKDLRRTAPEKLAECEEKASIIRAIEKRVGKSLQHNICYLQQRPQSAFWILSDLTFFQNESRKGGMSGQVFYVSSQLNVRNIPKFQNINQNLVDRIGGKELVLNNPDGKNLKDSEEYKKARPSTSKPSSCPGCKCWIREQLYRKNRPDIKGSIRLTYSQEGRLDPKKLKAQKWKFSIECSSICGCDETCTNRTVQKGQNVPLVVYYEDHEKGNVVRAGADIEAGEFISEYLGSIRPVDPSRNDRYSIEMGLIFKGTVVDALETGNVSRFYSHSCDPNAICVEVHSRTHETDPLIPRIGIFALKNIKMGEEIAFSYYEQDTLAEAASNPKGRTACCCKTKKCNSWIPKAKK